MPPPGVTLPSTDQAVSLLALMQHCRWPTRFLDVTEDLDVAAYFAARSAASSEFSIWAIKESWLESLARMKLDSVMEFSTFANAAYLSDPVAFESCFLKNEVTFVATIRIHNGFKRQQAQKGLFVAAGNITQPFEHDFRNTRYQHDIHRSMRRFDIAAECRGDLLAELAGAGITEDNLFPD
jgi:hypothetical protein